jgi:hypothetical protein
MEAAIQDMREHQGKLVRRPGGYWLTESGAFIRPIWGTSTIEAIVRRGFACYTSWQQGQRGSFPVEVALTSLAPALEELQMQ